MRIMGARTITAFQVVRQKDAANLMDALTEQTLTVLFVAGSARASPFLRCTLLVWFTPDASCPRREWLALACRHWRISLLVTTRARPACNTAQYTVNQMPRPPSLRHCHLRSRIDACVGGTLRSPSASLRLGYGPCLDLALPLVISLAACPLPQRRNTRPPARLLEPGANATPRSYHLISLLTSLCFKRDLLHGRQERLLRIRSSY